MSIKLEKTQTGIASEFYTTGELCRLGYNVTFTFGNTKSIDLLIQKDSMIYKVQVKGIQSSQSLCWTVDKTKITEDIFFVLVNLHVDVPEAKPEFFTLTAAEVVYLFKDTKKAGEKRAYLDYKRVRREHQFQNRWEIFGQPKKVAAKEPIS